jgi:hypothetical protein
LPIVFNDPIRPELVEAGAVVVAGGGVVVAAVAPPLIFLDPCLLDLL